MSRATLTVTETKMTGARFEKRTIAFHADVSADDESMLFAIEQAINDGGVLSALRAHVSLDDGDHPVIASTPAATPSVAPALPAGTALCDEVPSATQATPELPLCQFRYPNTMRCLAPKYDSRHRENHPFVDGQAAS